MYLLASLGVLLITFMLWLISVSKPILDTFFSDRGLGIFGIYWLLGLVLLGLRGMFLGSSICPVVGSSPCSFLGLCSSFAMIVC